MKTRSKSIFNIFTLFALLASLIGSAVFVTPVYAASYVVNTTADNITDDAFCTLREAINAANNTGGSNTNCGALSSADDTITFSVSGTITLGSQLPNIVSGQGTLTINGGSNVTISGNSAVRVLQVDSSATLTLQNITIANGRASGAGEYGGGVINNGTLTITSSTFSGNSSNPGSSFHGRGGAIDNRASATLNISNSTFSNNSIGAQQYGGGAPGGGAIYHGGSQLTVTGSTFSNNSAPNNGPAQITGGAGAILAGGNNTITNSTFSGNSAYIGGAYATDNVSTGTITGSTFSGNSAAQGGAINNYIQTLTIANSTFYSNTANATGGGGIAGGSNTTIINSTFSGNTQEALTGAGITLRNTIIANSTGKNCSDTVTNGGNNLQFGGTTANSCGATITTADPQLGTLTGSPAYFPLNSGSSAIDAGSNTVCAAAPVNNESQNSVTRPVDGDGNGTATCDIGSYEKPDTTAPTVISNSLVASYTTGPSSFTVTFSENVYDPAGNTDTDDVTNPNNYLLVEDGANGTFNTLSS